MSLTYIVNQKTGTSTQPRYTSIFPMAYIPMVDKKGRPDAMVVMDENDNSEQGSLERMVSYLGGSPQEIRDARQKEYAVRRAREIYTKFVDEGKYDKLVAWFSENSLEAPKKARLYAAKDTGGAAFTNVASKTGNFGVHPYIDEQIEKFAKTYRLSADEVEEIFATHETIHSAQDMAKYSSRLEMEADCELKCAKVFQKYAADANDSSAAERYLRMSDRCIMRYVDRKAADMVEKGEISPHELGPETAQYILEQSGFREYAKDHQPKGKVIEGKFGQKPAQPYSKAA